MRADVDGDGVVSILDFLQSVSGASERYNQDADDVISILDFAAMSGSFFQYVTDCQ